MDFMLLGSGLEVCAREERVEKGDELTHVVLTASSAKQYYRHARLYCLLLLTCSEGKA